VAHNCAGLQKLVGVGEGWGGRTPRTRKAAEVSTGERSGDARRRGLPADSGAWRADRRSRRGAAATGAGLTRRPRSGTARLLGQAGDLGVQWLGAELLDGGIRRLRQSGAAARLAPANGREAPSDGNSTVCSQRRAGLEREESANRCGGVAQLVPAAL
jgi:hypothetical protein